MRIALLLTLVMSVTSCDIFDTKSDFRDRVADETRARRDAWKAKNIHDYDFNYAKICECPTATTAKIEVRQDTVHRVLDDFGNDVTDLTSMRWPNVDSLFARALAVIDNHDLIIKIEFDTELHYPRIIESVHQANGVQVVHGAAQLTPVAAAIRQ